jgi:hypothetical protein
MPPEYFAITERSYTVGGTPLPLVSVQRQRVSALPPARGPGTDQYLVGEVSPWLRSPLRRLLSSFGRDAHVYLELTPIDLKHRSLPEHEALPRDDRAANGIGTQPDNTPPDAA